MTALVAGLVAAGLVPIAGAPPASAATPTFGRIASGAAHSCAVLSDGGAACWGANFDGQLGNGANLDSPVPVPVTTAGTPLAGKTISQIAAGPYQSCALTTEGNAACWGNNGNGQLGNNNGSSDVPVAVGKPGVLAGTSITQISSGVYSSCGVFSGRAACWGTDTYGQLGTGATVFPAPVITAGTPLAGKTIVYVGVGNLHACALASDSTMACWGSPFHGELGNGVTTTEATTTPVAVTTAGTPLAGKTIVAMDVGDLHTCVLTSEHKAACWGSNAGGQLGDGTIDNSPVPVGLITAGTPLAGTSIAQISSGSERTCAVTTDGIASCWGSSPLGNGTDGDSDTPVLVATAGTPLAGTTIVDIAAGFSHGCAVASDGVAACWGAGPQLGNGVVEQTFVPVEVAPLGTVAVKPGAPTAVTAVAGPAQATVSWTAPTSDGGSPITGYVVTPYIGSIAQTPVPFSSPASSQTITGLTTGTSYKFKVAATNAVGTGAQSALFSNPVTIPPPPGLPGAPTNAAAVAGNAQATVSWTAPASNGSAIVGYQVTPYLGSTAQVMVPFASTLTTQTITGLTNELTYTFKVAAVNAIGVGGQSASSNPVKPSAKTVPDAPETVTATARKGQVQLTWSAPQSDGGSPITGYVVTPFIGPTQQAKTNLGATALSATIGDLTNGVTYTFRVAAKNVIGTGPRSGKSNEVTMDMTPPVASIVTPTDWNLDPTVDVTWTGSDVGSGVKSFDVTRRQGAWNEPLEPTAEEWRSGNPTTERAFEGRLGNTYCFTVRARDQQNNLGAYSAQQCTALPLRTAQLTSTEAWVAHDQANSYNGRDLRSNTPSAKITRAGIVGVRSIALIATKGPTAGSVRVYWNGALKKTISLNAATLRRRRVVAALSFSAPTNGTLVLQPAGDGQVIIEGVGLSKAAT